jgi:hypothetical protein
MAVLQLTVTQKNRDTDYSDTLLLNTKRMSDYHPDSDGNTVFYYAEATPAGKKQNTEYHIAESFDQFTKKLRQAEDLESNQSNFDKVIVTLQALTRGVNEGTFNKNIGFHADNFVKAFADADNSSYSHIFLSYGGFKAVRYKVDATLTEIEGELSSSVSA